MNRKFSLPEMLKKKKQNEQLEKQNKLMSAIDEAIREHSVSVAEALLAFDMLAQGYKNYAAQKMMLTKKEEYQTKG